MLDIVMVIQGLIFKNCISVIWRRYHVLLVRSGQTTNEHLRRIYRSESNPYNHGCCGNFQEVCCAVGFSPVGQDSVTASEIQKDGSLQQVLLTESTGTPLNPRFACFETHSSLLPDMCDVLTIQDYIYTNFHFHIKLQGGEAWSASVSNSTSTASSPCNSVTASPSVSRSTLVATANMNAITKAMNNELIESTQNSGNRNALKFNIIPPGSNTNNHVSAPSGSHEPFRSSFHSALSMTSQGTIPQSIHGKHAANGVEYTGNIDISVALSNLSEAMLRQYKHRLKTFRCSPIPGEAITGASADMESGLSHSISPFLVDGLPFWKTIKIKQRRSSANRDLIISPQIGHEASKDKLPSSGSSSVQNSNPDNRSPVESSYGSYNSNSSSYIQQNPMFKTDSFISESADNSNSNHHPDVCNDNEMSRDADEYDNDDFNEQSEEYTSTRDTDASTTELQAPTGVLPIVNQGFENINTMLINAHIIARSHEKVLVTPSGSIDENYDASSSI